MEINLNSIRDYVYKINKDYKEQEIDSTIYIYEDKQILSFTIGLQNVGNLMMGLDLFKKTYNENPILKDTNRMLSYQSTGCYYLWYDMFK